ncbi:hypothetical protein D3C71_2116490 [compost metagenome]
MSRYFARTRMASRSFSVGIGLPTRQDRSFKNGIFVFSAASFRSVDQVAAISSSMMNSAEPATFDFVTEAK